MRKFVVVALLSAVAWGDAPALAVPPIPPDLLDAYDRGRELGIALFSRAYVVGGDRWRVISTLKVCGYEGLADAVGEKEPDPGFSKAFGRMMAEDKYKKMNVTFPAKLHMQQTAMAMRTGFMIGYDDGLRLLPDDLREVVCKVGVERANELMK